MATSIMSEDQTAGPTDALSTWNSRANIDDPHTVEPLAYSWPYESISGPSSCDNLSHEVELMSRQLTDPAPLRSRYGEEDIKSWMLLNPPDEGENENDFVCICAVCHQPSAAHFVSIHNTAPQETLRSILNDIDGVSFGVPTTTKEEGAWKWIALCFASCLNLTKYNTEIATELLEHASAQFEKLLMRRDSLLLTAANQMVTILHQHDQGEIATKITAIAKSVTDRRLVPGDPIRTTFDYFAATADSSTTTAALRSSGIDSATLSEVQEHFNCDSKYGAQHPYTIAASYNHAWLLRREGKFKEAEERLIQVYKTSCSIFGRHHMQSIVALATLAGSQFDQKRTNEAIHNFKTVIRDCESTLGKSHPYRLEAKRRLAWQYGDLGQKEKMVPLYWDVLAGRVRMLGRKHRYTVDQKIAYEELMKELGRWDEAAEKMVEALFINKHRAEEEVTRRRRSGSESSNEIECEAY